MARALCRRRTGEALPRAEKFGDLITADHKVLNEGCESRDNHGYACRGTRILPLSGFNLIRVKQRLHMRRKEVYQNSWSRHTKPKVIHTDNSSEFGKSYEGLAWNHRTSTPHRSETNGIAETAVRRVKERTSAVLLQSGLDERWSDSMECYCCLRNVKDLLEDVKTLYERRFGEPFKGPVIPFGAMVEYHPISAIDLSRIHQLGKKVLTGIFLDYELIAGGIWKGDILIADVKDSEKLDASEIYPRRINVKEVLITPKIMNSYSQ